MRVTLDAVAIGTGLGAEVPPMSVVVTGPSPVAIAVETDERPLLVSMLIGGRTKGDAGLVLVDGIVDDEQLRRRTALVDTPFVAEPTPGITLSTIVAEEFSFAGLPTSRRAVGVFLTRHGLADYSRLPIRALPAADRVRLFAELAVLRPDVGTIVVTSPERHGGTPADWYGPLAAIADRGITVAVVTDFATAGVLVSLGARDGLLEWIEPEPEPELESEPEPEPEPQESN